MSFRADGRHMVSQRVEGKRIYGYGPTDEEARADLKSKLTPSINEDDFHGFAKEFWFPIFQNLEPLTQTKYKSVYRNWVRPFFKGRKLEEIKFPTIQEWVNWMKEQKAGDATVRYSRTMLSGIFEIACDLEMIHRNPCKSKRITVPKRSPKRVRVLGIQKALEVLEGVKGTDLSAPVFLALVLGLRRGEIAGLQWKHFNPEDGTLTVDSQRQAQSKKGIVEKEAKAGSTGVLKLTPEIVQEIESRGNLDSGFICTRLGKPWVPQTIYDDWLLVRGKFGLNNWTLHDLRHGAAGLYVATGADMFQVASVLRHKNPNMSLTYSAREESAQGKGIEELSRRLLTQNPADSQNRLSSEVN